MHSNQLRLKSQWKEGCICLNAHKTSCLTMIFNLATWSSLIGNENVSFSFFHRVKNKLNPIATSLTIVLCFHKKLSARTYLNVFFLLAFRFYCTFESLFFWFFRISSLIKCKCLLPQIKLIHAKRDNHRKNRNVRNKKKIHLKCKKTNNEHEESQKSDIKVNKIK